MQIDELAQLIEPRNTVLLLGAGAAVGSGGPTGNGLAQHLAGKLKLNAAGFDLVEIAGIYEAREGRKPLVTAVRERLNGLEPTGGMLALPAFDWRAMYSTNFDRLVEKAYTKAGRRLAVVRSNYEYKRSEGADAVLYKIHGCITQDVADGNHARMVLTETDYDDVKSYRETLFNSLQLHMTTADTLIVGQSLTDPHLRDLAKQVGALRQKGVEGRVFLLAYEYDDDRAMLMSQKGIQVTGGSIDDLVHALTGAGRTSARPAHTTETRVAGVLPPALAPVTRDVAHAAQLSANVRKLFNGSPATYADIAASLTIVRAIERRLLEAQEGARGFFLVLAGAAGVGKTTLARSIMLKRSAQGFHCWEHVNEYPLDVDEWLAVEATLRSNNEQGMLLVDDCVPKIAALNKLVDALGKLDRPFLRIVVTANGGHWRTRTKSRFFFSRGTLEHLKILTSNDINELVNLVDTQPRIRELVEDEFLHLGRRDRVRRLRDRCRADMFVCLKNIFRSEQLNNILLQEYADLSEPHREVYRHVAALQAMGTRVHRQLVVRLLGIDSTSLLHLLDEMSDVVSEYDISVRKGLFGWETRHDVIANVIATLKFADQEALRDLLERLIEGLNPTLSMERDTAVAIATNEMGIARLNDVTAQMELFDKLIQTVPAERTPRRRLTRLLLHHGDLDEAERVIDRTRKDIGEDNIITRYRSNLALRRAESMTTLLPEDRRAMLLEAERLARKSIAGNAADRYNYRALSEVGLVFAREWDEFDVLDEAIGLMLQAESEVGDPDFADERRKLEVQRRHLVAG